MFVASRTKGGRKTKRRYLVSSFTQITEPESVSFEVALFNDSSYRNLSLKGSFLQPRPQGLGFRSN